MQVMRPGAPLSRVRFHFSREAWAAALLTALAVYGAFRLVRALALRPARPDEAARLRAEAERLLVRGGVVPDAGEGLEELRHRLARTGHPLTRPVDALTRRYLEARFGTRPLVPGERKRLLEPLRGAVARLARRG
jgi:hypothetical protein